LSEKEETVIKQEEKGERHDLREREGRRKGTADRHAREREREEKEKE